jgi:DNA repair exonuclease SbcCD ATPase subunit
MKLKKIEIKEFGPIKNFSVQPGKITVIHGDNETGKTTILDALLDALFQIRQRSEKKQFQGLDRYEENVKFSGTVEVEDNGKLLAFPGDIRLDKAAGVSNFRYIRNLLVVRESDLEPKETTAQKFWSELKDKLSGFEHGLTGITENIRDEVGLTPEGKWINRAGRRIQDEIDKLIFVGDRLKELTDQVEELSRIKSRRERLLREEKEKEKRKTALKEAREREKYESAARAYRKLKEGQERLKSFSTLNPSALQEWRKILAEIGTMKESIRNRENEKNILQSRISEKEEEVKSLQDTVSTWERREAEVVPAVQQKINEIRNLEQQKQKTSRFLPLALSAATVLAALTLFLIILAALRSTSFLATAIFPAALSVYLVVLWFRCRSISAALEEEKNRLTSTFKNLIEPTGASDAQSWIEEERRIFERAKGEIAAKTKEIEKDKNYLKQLSSGNSGIRDLQDKISALRQQEEKLRDQTGCDTVSELEQKLKERNEELLPVIQRQKDALSNILGTDSEDDWQDKIEQLKRYQSAEGDSDEKALERLERELEKSRNERELLLEKEREVDKKLIEVGADTPEDAWDKIEEVQQKLSSFERDQKAAKLAISIIEELAQQQESLINSVLESGENSASRYFRLATRNRYKSVFYQKGEIFAQTPQGQKFNFDQLSSGARAQLLFSIRVALLERLFADKPLFLLLDDPFISSDRPRLEKLLEMLFSLCDAGWQVMYFTVDRDVPEILTNIARKLRIPSGADGLVLKELPPGEIASPAHK